MTNEKEIDDFLSRYSKDVYDKVAMLRKMLQSNLPGVIEQIDHSANMIAYCYGQKYVEMICTIFPSKKGVKLAFYKGIDLPDPQKWLKGDGKMSRYVEIKSLEQTNSDSVINLVHHALGAYKQRMVNT